MLKSFQPYPRGFTDLITDYSNGIVWIEYDRYASDAERQTLRDTVGTSPFVSSIVECAEHADRTFGSPPSTAGP